MEMPDDETFATYERLYYWELERHNQIDSRAPVLLAIVLAVVGMQSYLIKKYIPLGPNLYNISTMIPFFLSAACLVIAVVYLYRSWSGPEYLFIPKTSTLEEYRNYYRNYLKENGFSESDQDTFLAEYTRLQLCEYYVECESENHATNYSKSTRLHVALNWLVGSICFGVISYIFWILRS